MGSTVDKIKGYTDDVSGNVKQASIWSLAMSAPRQRRCMGSEVNAQKAV